MAAALIRIDQATHPTQVIGTPGISRDNIVLASPVQLANGNDTGVRSRRWELLSRPDGSAAVLSSPTDAAVNFTPDIIGTYRVRLTVNEGRKGEVDTRLVAVRDAQGFRIPAAGEENEANWDTNVLGWHPDMELLLLSISNANVLFTMKNAARLATDAALPAHTFDSGAGSLTASANGALTVDTVAVAANDRIIVKDEGGGTSAENGLYRVVQTGDGGTPWILLRTTDANTDDKVKAGMFVIAAEGANADKGWFIITDDPIVVNTTAITFDEFPLTLPSWNQTLAVSPASGGVTPQISSGDDLVFRGGGVDQDTRYAAAFPANTTNDKRIRWAADDTLQFGHFNGSTFDQAFQVANDGFLRVQGNSGLLSGSGVPNNAVGNDGDITFRDDGDIDTSLYVKLSGTWTAFVTVPAGVTTGSTLRWSGTAWVENDDLIQTPGLGISLLGTGSSDTKLSVTHGAGLQTSTFGMDGTEVLSIEWKATTVTAPETKLQYSTATKAWSWLHDDGGGIDTIVTFDLDAALFTFRGDVRADNTAAASTANTVRYSAFGNVTTTGLVEAVRLEAGFDDIGQATNVTTFRIFTREANVLEERVIFNGTAATFTTDIDQNIGSAIANSALVGAADEFQFNVDDGTNARDGGWSYDTTTDLLTLRAANAAQMTLDGSTLTLPTNNFTMSGTSATFTMGDGATAGTPVFNILKGPTGAGDLKFFSGDLTPSLGDIIFELNPAEVFNLFRHDGTAFRSVQQWSTAQAMELLNGAQANALVTIGNPAFTTAQEANMLLLGGATSSPSYQFIDPGNRIEFSESPQVMEMIINNAVVLTVSTSATTIAGVLNHDGSSVGLFGVTPVSQNTGWTTFANLTTVKTLDADSTTLGEVADVLGTLVEAVKDLGPIAA